MRRIGDRKSEKGEKRGERGVEKRGYMIWELTEWLIVYHRLLWVRRNSSQTQKLRCLFGRRTSSSSSLTSLLHPLIAEQRFGLFSFIFSPFDATPWGAHKSAGQSLWSLNADPKSPVPRGGRGYVPDGWPVAPPVDKIQQPGTSDED